MSRIHYDPEDTRTNDINQQHYQRTGIVLPIWSFADDPIALPAMELFHGGNRLDAFCEEAAQRIRLAGAVLRRGEKALYE